MDIDDSVTIVIHLFGALAAGGVIGWNEVGMGIPRVSGHMRWYAWRPAC